MEANFETKEQYVTRIAAEYVALPHTPSHPSYKAFIRETLGQMDTLVRSGWRFKLSSTVPYADSLSMFADCAKHKLIVYSGGSLTLDSPLLKLSPFSDISGRRMTINEVFRAVHDVNGHFTANAGFESFEDEMTAYHQHRAMYSKEALGTLRGETVGQLCYFYANGKFVNLQECKVMTQYATR